MLKTLTQNQIEMIEDIAVMPNFFDLITKRDKSIYELFIRDDITTYVQLQEISGLSHKSLRNTVLRIFSTAASCIRYAKKA